MLRKVNVLLKKCDLSRARIKDGIALETRRDNSLVLLCIVCCQIQSFSRTWSLSSMARSLQKILSAVKDHHHIQ